MCVYALAYYNGISIKVAPFSSKPADDKHASQPSVRRVCIPPKMNINDPSIMKFYKKYPTVKCIGEPDWLKIERGHFIITTQAKDANGNITCKGKAILQKGDHSMLASFVYGPEFKIVNGTPVVDSDFYKVDCQSDKGKNYR